METTILIRAKDSCPQCGMRFERSQIVSRVDLYAKRVGPVALSEVSFLESELVNALATHRLTCSFVMETDAAGMTR